MTFMIALYCATHLGGGIPAILVNIPGTGGAAATTLDGYPMAQQGKGQQALMLCFLASVFGGLISRSEEHTSELQSLMRISYAVFCLKQKILSKKRHERLN